MRTLLITGSTGFIGKNILNYIKLNFDNKFKVILLSSKENTDYVTIIHKNYKFRKSCFYKKGVSKVDVILHIGAFTPKSGEEANNIEESNSNIRNTKYLLDNLPNTPKKFIFLSTLDVYGRIITQIDEKANTSPLSMYGWSKLYCEKMIENWALEKKVLIQILRVGHIYGKGEEIYKKLIPVTITKIKNDENPIIFGSGKELRSFLYINDLCNLVLNSISLDKYEGVINLCSSKSYSVEDIVNFLLEISNKKLNIEYRNKKDIGINLVFDTSLMNLLLGYEKVDIKDGLYNEYN